MLHVKLWRLFRSKEISPAFGALVAICNNSCGATGGGENDETDFPGIHGSPVYHFPAMDGMGRVKPRIRAFRVCTGLVGARKATEGGRDNGKDNG